MIDLEALMAHARMMSDKELLADFEDCLLVLAGSDKDINALAAYFEARRQAPYFAPGGKTNNHQHILVTPVRALGKRPNAVCEVDEKPFWRQRKTAKYCSTACRMRAMREGAESVTLSTSNTQ